MMEWYDRLLSHMADRLFSLDVSPGAYPLVLLAGLLTNLCPCTIALVPLVIGYVGGFSRRQRARALAYSAAFAGGIVVTLCVLGVLATLVGALLAPFGNLFQWVVAAVALVMGLVCLGVFQRVELPWLQRLTSGGPVERGWLRKRRGAVGAFLFGLVAGTIATPCTTPVLAVILAYVAAAGRLLYGLSLLLTYSVGFAIPLLLAGAFAGFLATLQRLQASTNYQGWIARISGVVLIGFALYLMKSALGL
jgi:cytochrome c-type biogenesis protein